MIQIFIFSSEYITLSNDSDSGHSIEWNFKFIKEKYQIINTQVHRHMQ